MGVVKTPDLTSAPIGYVGVYDLNSSCTVRRRESLERRAEVPGEALGTDQVDRDGALTDAQRGPITVPVFLVEGMQDDRVPTIALRRHERGAPEDKQHRFETLACSAPRTAPETGEHARIACRMIDFFDRHIGDRKPMDKPDDCQFPGAKEPQYEYFEGRK